MRVALSIVFWLAVLAVPATLFWNPSITVSFTATEAASIADKKLPFTGSKSGVQFEVPKGLEIEFRDDGRIGVATDFVAKPSLTNESRFEGWMQVNARMVYEDRAFYARDIVLEAVDGRPILSDRAEAVTSFLGKSARAIGQATGISKEDLGAVLGIQNVDQSAFDFLTDKLEQMPLYEISKAPYWAQLAGDALVDLWVEDQTLIAEIAIGTLVSQLLLTIAIIAVALVILYLLLNGGLEAIVRSLSFGLFEIDN